MNTDQLLGTVPRKKATVLQRFLAYVIDMIIVGILGGIVQDGWIVTALTAIYFIWPYSTTGQTLGKRALNIKVVSIDGSPLDWKKGILRSIGYLSSILFGIGFLWALWDSDRQAFHDKIAGTYVVPASVVTELVVDNIQLTDIHRRQRRWLIGLGIPAILVVVGFVLFVQGRVAEVREMGPWPSTEYSPQDVAAVDLSNLGLQPGQTLDPRDEGSWSDGNYRDGIFKNYIANGNDAVGIWMLRYEDKQLAAKDYQRWRAWAEAGNCGIYTYANWGRSGVIHCQFSDAYDKIFWNDCWIIDIIAIEGTEFTPEVLVDLVQDALADHWREIEKP